MERESWKLLTVRLASIPLSGANLSNEATLTLIDHRVSRAKYIF